MEDNLQRVFSVLISVLILFLMPLYITFEKMDDISYSLALKITSNFVDTVNAKGYITEEMYNDFVKELSVTGNMYDVKMEHVAKKYNPVYYIYDDEKNVVEVLDYAMYTLEISNSENTKITVNGKDYTIRDKANESLKDNIKLSYSTSEIKYTNKQILSVFDYNSETIPYSLMDPLVYRNQPKTDISTIPYMYGNYKYETQTNGNLEAVLDNDNIIYTMNKGDEFNVRIKNENTTIATVLFNAFTLGIGGAENNTRIYINYGGTVTEEEYKNLDKVINDVPIPFILGDVNLDGRVDSEDAELIQKYLLKSIEFDDNQIKRADYNQDGNITKDDAVAIIKK